jgi:hypothetical protein
MEVFLFRIVSFESLFKMGFRLFLKRRSLTHAIMRGNEPLYLFDFSVQF